ncbi:nucleotide pyrophosphohydrolase [Egicoccus halophilus]|uniref:Nucleotide pyrophosphohydrolase n=2 Tax=Egicoccus halophilus TaxID=1670830 RepID=A0A8J3AHE2_9ACTN|nr:nucleotide pyrophosphohydrolase [Egicoccus halophilus]
MADLRQTLRAFARERDWEQFQTPKNLVMALSGEVGELTEIFQWLTAEESAAVMEGGRSADVEDELADVLIYLVRLADVLGVDLVAAAQAKMIRNETRFPAAAVRGQATRSPDRSARDS